MLLFSSDRMVNFFGLCIVLFLMMGFGFGWIWGVLGCLVFVWVRVRWGSSISSGRRDRRWCFMW